MQQASRSAGRRTYVVGCDVKRDIRVFSGSTYHLAQQGAEDGLLSGMVNLYPKGIGSWLVYARAGLWKLGGGLHGRHGYKFTDQYLEGIWRPALATLAGARIINNFQLFGSYFLQSYRAFGIEPYPYIDGTLDEYFGNYRTFDTANIDPTAMHKALELEREGYACCRKIAVMSRRTAENINRNYGVPQHKIHIVPPGANIPDRLLAALDNQPQRFSGAGKNPFTIGFIGLYPERKGLPRIAEAVHLLRSTGYDVRLHVIGGCPRVISQQDGVTHFGLIDKSVDIDRFIDIITKVDIGCMLSRAELTGIALLEFLRMGVPVIATDVGGTPDIVELGAGHLVSPEISAEGLAQHIAGLIDEPEQLLELRERARRERHNASWSRAVRELTTIMDSYSPESANETTGHLYQS